MLLGHINDKENTHYYGWHLAEDHMILGICKKKKTVLGDSFFHWDVIYFNTDLDNEDNGSVGSAKAVFR